MEKTIILMDDMLAALNKLKLFFFIGTVILLVLWLVTHDLVVTMGLPAIVFTVLNYAWYACLFIIPILFLFQFAIKLFRKRVFFKFIKKRYFTSPTISKDTFMEIVRIKEVNLRSLGFTSAQKEFSYEDVLFSFKRMAKLEKHRNSFSIPGISSKALDFSDLNKTL